MFIFTSFTANIVALLQSTTKSIRTVADLQNPAFEIGVHDTPFNRYFLSVETEPTKQKLYNTKILPSNGPDAFMNFTYGISRMREGMFAFHTETGRGYSEVQRTFFEHEKCGLVQIKFFEMSEVWIFTPKRSPYREIMKTK